MENMENMEKNNNDSVFDNTLIIPLDLMDKLANIARCQKIQLLKNITKHMDNITENHIEKR